MQDITEQIKEARKVADYTQQQVADLTGIALITYKQYEGGRRWPSYDYLLLLSSVLKTSFIIVGE